MIYVLMHYTDSFKELVDISRPILTEYCEAHGYRLDIRKVPQYERYTGMEKLQHVMDVLSMGDVALVLDADACVTNFYQKIEDFLCEDKDLYFAEGMNAGVFIVRKTENTKRFFVCCVGEVYFGKHDCEQDFFNTHKNAGNHFICVLPHPCFNSYLSELYPEIPQPVTEEQGQWVEGSSFVIHLPGLSMEKRKEILQTIKITK